MQYSFSQHDQRGFTLVETVVAILILSLSIGSLLTLAAGGFFSVRYARNQIVADNMVQESLEYFRNSRDTAVLQETTWSTWLQTFNVNDAGVMVDPVTPIGCFATAGCSVDPYTDGPKILACNGTCPTTLLFPDEGFYGYRTGSYPFGSGTPPVATTYVRRINAEMAGPDQVLITATISWRNGTALKTVSQSMMLSNWNQL